MNIAEQQIKNIRDIREQLSEESIYLICTEIAEKHTKLSGKIKNELNNTLLKQIKGFKDPFKANKKKVLDCIITLTATKYWSNIFIMLWAGFNDDLIGK